MILKNLFPVAFLVVFSGIHAAFALEHESENRKHEISAHRQIEERFEAANVKIAISDVAESDIPNWYRATLSDKAVAHINLDSGHVMIGRLLKFEEGKIRDLTREGLQGEIRKLIPLLAKQEALSWLPSEDVGVKANIYVFYDADCGYCRHLHKEVDALNDAGVAVHYLGFPRAGVGSASYEKLVTAWCSENPQEAFDRLAVGDSLQTVNCDNPVEEHLRLGKKLGVRGTPAIFLESGRMLPGYKPADELLDYILPPAAVKPSGDSVAGEPGSTAGN